MVSKAPPPSSPAGVPSGGNGKYIVVAILLLGVIGGAVYWKLSQKGPDTVVPNLPDAAPPPSATHNPDDDIPLPPPAEDAGPDAGKKPIGPTTLASQCDAKRCAGASTSELESTLAFRAQQSKKRCWYPALNADPTLKGKAAISVRVGATGTVCSANVASADPGLSNVASCTASYFRGVPMPQPHGGCVDVSVPINYVGQ